MKKCHVIRCAICVAFLLFLLCGCDCANRDIIGMIFNGISGQGMEGGAGGLVTSVWIQNRLNDLNQSISKEKEMGEERIKAILTAMEQQDEDTIYLMFSPEAQESSEYLREGIRSLFSSFDGEIVSYEQLGLSDTKSNEPGVIVSCTYSYELHTSTSEYLMGISEVIWDDNDTNNLGLYQIRVIKSDYGESGSQEMEVIVSLGGRDEEDRGRQE